jgi:hypothetical protein
LFVLKVLHSENFLVLFTVLVVAVMGGEGRVEVVSGKGCSRLFSSSFTSVRGLQPLEQMSSVSSSPQVSSNAPFAGLVICVTGLSKGVDSFHLCSIGFRIVFLILVQVIG